MKTIKENQKHSKGYIIGYENCRLDVLELIDEMKLEVGWEEADALNKLKARIEGKDTVLAGDEPK